MIRVLESVEEVQACQSEMTNAVVIISLEDCEPCVLVKNAVKNTFEKHSGIKSYFAHCLLSLSKDDKKEIGKIALAGIKSFPTVRVYVEGVKKHSFNGVPTDWTLREGEEFFEAKLSQYL